MTSCLELFMHICLCKYRVVEAVPVHILSNCIKCYEVGVASTVIHVDVYICICTSNLSTLVLDYILSEMS